MAHTLSREDVENMISTLKEQPEEIKGSEHNHTEYNEESYHSALSTIEDFLNDLVGKTINSKFLYVTDYDFNPHIYFELNEEEGTHIWFFPENKVLAKGKNNEVVAEDKEAILEKLVEKEYITKN